MDHVCIPVFAVKAFRGRIEQTAWPLRPVNRRVEIHGGYCCAHRGCDEQCYEFQPHFMKQATNLRVRYKRLTVQRLTASAMASVKTIPDKIPMIKSRHGTCLSPSG